MATSTFKNNMDFWEDQTRRALENLNSKIQATIALYPIAEKFSIEDIREWDHEYPLEIFLKHYDLEELYNAGKETGFKSIEASYQGLEYRLKGYRENGLVEDDYEGLKALCREAEEREYEISNFLSTLRELIGACPDDFADDSD